MAQAACAPSALQDVSLECQLCVYIAFECIPECTRLAELVNGTSHLSYWELQQQCAAAARMVKVALELHLE